MSCKTDLVSVIIPVKNCSLYIVECVNSILHQTHQNFEILICDDHSCDNSLELIEALDDDRIIIFKNEGSGLVDALNNLILRSNGDYICRMDADDIALPERIQRQLQYLKLSNLDCVGSFACVIDSMGRVKNKILSRPKTTVLIDTFLLHGVPIIHPSAFGNAEFFKKYGYRHLPSAEDYDLWVRAREGNEALGNVPEVLLKYRIHSNQLSKLKRNEQAQSSSVIRSHLLTSDSVAQCWKFTLSVSNLRRSFLKLWNYNIGLPLKLSTFAKILVREFKCIF
jgi:glycosyltransferase involved in cell wall biosynthesis